MRISDAEILAFCQDKNPNATSDDVEAFKRFAVAFECEDAETAQEVHEKVLASMDAIQMELEGKSREEQALVILTSGLSRLVGMEPL
jgi:hypothetical protein